MEISARTVSQLRRMAKERDCLGEEFLQALARDPRRAVQCLYQELRAQQERLALEKERVARLFVWEKKLGSPDLIVAGIDEAGRGPLAGPVVAGAVILTPDLFIRGLNDSKRISSKARESIAREIRQKALAWSLGWASVKEIEELNIRQASFLAMKRAVEGLAVVPEHLLVDGFFIPGLEIKQTKLVKGDCLSASIAAASILAKEARDKYMIKLHQRFPCYGFARHKGYPTREHFQALAEYGPSPEHRCTFKGVKDLLRCKLLPE